MQQLVILPHEEQQLRLNRLRDLMQEAGADALLVTDNANTYYLSGRVFMGWIYIPRKGEPIYFVRRPVELQGDGVVYVRKPEQMTETIGALNMPQSIALELDVTSYTTIERLAAIFPGAKIINGSSILKQARSVKTKFEIGMLKISGEKQSRIYRHINRLYSPDMTDIEFQVEIERALRLDGCLGQFRISGDSMELFMGSVLVGNNADNPTPYDFAMGGAGIDPSLPAGANGSIIKPGDTIMIDMNGNFTGYMTDMTRTAALGDINPTALRAHRLSIEICHELAKTGRPGVKAKDLYEQAEKMVEEAGLYEYFMGHRQKAGFIGHGVGIEVNELPVIAPRSRDILAKGNVIALEPKFVIPGTGAVGIENTYVVGPEGMTALVDCPEEITYLTD